MNHRHLLPEEIDQLLDDEEGFGMAPLKAHLAECARCQGELRSLQGVVGHLETLPLLSPKRQFADRVMSQVEVFEPWHVAARDTVARILPRSSVGKGLAAAIGGTAAVATTAVGVWALGRADAFFFVTELAASRARDWAVSGARAALVALLGSEGAAAIQTAGPLGILAATCAAAIGIGVVAFGLKSLATSARRRV